jgi:hypothetical protein
MTHIEGMTYIEGLSDVLRRHDAYRRCSLFHFNVLTFKITKPALYFPKAVAVKILEMGNMFL